MTPSELLAFYKYESPLEIELAGRRHVLPISDFFGNQHSAGTGVHCKKIDAKFHVDEGLSDYVIQARKRLEKDGKFFDGTVARVCSCDVGWLRLQPASYLEGIATNFSMDHLPPGGTQTLRRLLHGRTQRFEPFESSRLVNHLGVVCMVETVEGMLIVQNRSRQVANRWNTLTSSLSGSVNWEDVQNLGELSDACGIGRAVIREGQEELGVTLERVFFLGLFREFMRGGKPEAYFYARTNETLTTVIDRWKDKSFDRTESTGICGYEFQSERLSSDADSAAQFESRVNGILESVKSGANLTLTAGILLTGNYLLKRVASG